MTGVSDFFVEFLKLNEGFPFETVIFGLIAYISTLWFVISIWVYFDAKKRYENSLTSLLFALLVLFLNFPMLVFYFAVRPDITFEDFDDWEAGGVNVPIVNFMGKEGIEMSFELRLNPKRLRDVDKSPDMNIQIGWDNEDEKFKLIDREELARQVVESDKMRKRDKNSESKSKVLVTYFDKVAGSVKKTVKTITSKVKDAGNSANKKSEKNMKEMPKNAQKISEENASKVNSNKNKSTEP